MTKPAVAALAVSALLIVGGVAWTLLGGPPESPSPIPTPDTQAAPQTPASAPPREMTMEEKEKHLEELMAEQERKDKEHRAQVEKEIAAKAAVLAKTMGDRKTDCDMVEMPFADAVKYFADRHGVKLVIDDAVLKDVKDVTISMRFKETTLARVVVILGALAGVAPVPEGDGVRFQKLP